MSDRNGAIHADEPGMEKLSLVQSRLLAWILDPEGREYLHHPPSTCDRLTPQGN